MKKIDGKQFKPQDLKNETVKPTFPVEITKIQSDDINMR